MLMYFALWQLLRSLGSEVYFARNNTNIPRAIGIKFVSNLLSSLVSYLLADFMGGWELSTLFLRLTIEARASLRTTWYELEGSTLRF